MEIRIKDEFIKLGQALKLAGVVEDGVEAKYAINPDICRQAVRALRTLTYPNCRAQFCSQLQACASHTYTHIPEAAAYISCPLFLIFPRFYLA